MTCPAPYDAQTASAFCTVKEWHRVERMEHAADVSDAMVLPLAFVARPPDTTAWSSSTPSAAAPI
jgi:hypothetical protein